MAAKATTAQINAMITKFLGNYERVYGQRPTDFNRFREKWGFRDMIEDLGYARAGEVIDYYFETRHIGHPATTLFYEYDKLDQIMRERVVDEENRARLRQESELRVKEWREKHGK
jgi:hypothetical protein